MNNDETQNSKIETVATSFDFRVSDFIKFENQGRDSNADAPEEFLVTFRNIFLPAVALAEKA